MTLKEADFGNGKDTEKGIIIRVTPARLALLMKTRTLTFHTDDSEIVIRLEAGEPTEKITARIV